MNRPITAKELASLESDLYNYWSDENPRCQLIQDLIENVRYWQENSATYKVRAEYWQTHQVNSLDVRDLMDFAERFLPAHVAADLMLASTIYAFFMRLKEHLR